MNVLVGADFFTVEVLTWRGLVTYYVLFFLHLGSRRVRVAGITRHPDQEWMEQIARSATQEKVYSMEGSNKTMLAGRILTVLTALFMLLDGVMKIVKPAQVLEANVRLAYPVSTLSGIGIALIVCTVIYLIPRTAILGAVLLTGYLGGAVASNVRAGSGLLETIFPMLFAALVWAGLWLRDRRLRSLLIDKETTLVTNR